MTLSQSAAATLAGASTLSRRTLLLNLGGDQRNSALQGFPSVFELQQAELEGISANVWATKKLGRGGGRGCSRSGPRATRPWRRRT